VGYEIDEAYAMLAEKRVREFAASLDAQIQ
jgi:hypothetical protein